MGGVTLIRKGNFSWTPCRVLYRAVEFISGLTPQLNNAVSGEETTARYCEDTGARVVMVTRSAVNSLLYANINSEVRWSCLFLEEFLSKYHTQCNEHQPFIFNEFMKNLETLLK